MFEKSELSDKAALLDEPRARHYVMAHVALKQVCEQDPHYFFGAIGSSEQKKFVEHMITQVEEHHPEDPTLLDADEFNIVLSRVGNYPLVLIELPKPQAYVECFYVGIVAMVDLSQSKIDEAVPEILYFTLELAEGELADCSHFCQWKGETHINLAEVESVCSLDEFSLLIQHKVQAH